MTGKYPGGCDEIDWLGPRYPVPPLMVVIVVIGSIAGAIIMMLTGFR